jgi:hypothetical protein
VLPHVMVELQVCFSAANLRHGGGGFPFPVVRLAEDHDTLTRSHQSIDGRPRPGRVLVEQVAEVVVRRARGGLHRTRARERVADQLRRRVHLHEQEHDICGVLNEPALQMHEQFAEVFIVQIAVGDAAHVTDARCTRVLVHVNHESSHSRIELLHDAVILIGSAGFVRAGPDLRLTVESIVSAEPTDRIDGDVSWQHNSKHYPINSGTSTFPPVFECR